MATLIQKKAGIVNLIETSFTAGQTIIGTFSLDCVAEPVNKPSPEISLVQILDCNGKPDRMIPFTATLEVQDEGGVITPFVGTMDDLINKLNSEYFISAAGGGGGTSDTTAANQVLGLANQDTQLSHSAKLLSGSTIDLTVDDNGEWIGFPFTMNGTNAIRIEDNESLEFVFNSIAVINKIEDLIEELQNKQSLLSFSKNTATSLLVNDGTKTVDSITLVELVNTGAGLVYDKAESAWGELTPLVLSAVQELNERSKTELANLKAISGKLDDILTKQPGTLESLRLSNPSNVIFTGFKALSFSCDGVNDSITVTQGGVPVTYPHANLDGSLIRGYEIPLNDVAYSNSITFNGTGTVDVFKID